MPQGTTVKYWCLYKFLFAYNIYLTIVRKCQLELIGGHLSIK